MDFRSSLIAQGRAVYEYAIQDAESLVSLDTGELEEMFEEGYLYAPTKAYEQINGSQPDTGVTRKTEPSGTEWNETRASLQELFPRAWALYGWEEAKSPPLTLKKPWWKLLFPVPISTVTAKVRQSFSDFKPHAVGPPAQVGLPTPPVLFPNRTELGGSAKTGLPCQRSARDGAQYRH